ncbi:ABC transporter family substrate-binding protein [Gandjariella thermophila]|uniref:ABC transporter substrate-binding protein n=1 Tax=Gandjariella thermophila TaxID=1931992 RepID=A0A4D4JH22_9PSEU|nr:ABC transporter family substrate-binding protein [Gandjariella thermophila]GDY33197.1 ABC transporter substrate-binding protein [Gandjariella thermophila]
MAAVRRRWTLLAAPLAAGALLLSACGGGGGSGQSAQFRQFGVNDINPQPVEKVKQGGTLNLAITAPIENYNYNQVQGVSKDLNDVILPILPSIFTNNPDSTVSLNRDYLESADVTSTNPQVITYRINPKAKWSDGTPMTWRDFAAQWKAMSGTPGYLPATTTGYQDIGSVERGANDQEVKVTFKNTFAEWKSLFGPLYPASANDNPDAFNKGWLGRIPVTAGPFRVKSIDATAKTVTEEADPNWWGAKPKLDTIVFHPISPDQMAQAFANGTIDAVDIGPSVPIYQQVQQVPGAKIHRALAPNWRVLNFNGAPTSVLADPKLRTAIFKGINRDVIAKAEVGPIMPDAHPLQNHIYMEGQQGYQDNGGPYAYNKDEAARALDALGWKLNGDTREKDGRKLEIRWVVPAGVKVSADEAQLAQKQLAEIGVRVNIQTVDSTAWQNQYINVGNFDVQNMSWIGVPFPLSSSTSIYTFDPNSVNQNYGRVPDTAGLNDLYRQANAELDDAKRMQLGNRIDQAIWQEGFSLPLYQRPDAVGAKANLANYGAFGFGQPDWTKIGFTS